MPGPSPGMTKKKLAARLTGSGSSSRSVAEAVSVPLAAPVMILAFLFVLQRAMSGSSGLESDGAMTGDGLK